VPDGIHQFAIGNVVAWVISDGTMAIDGGAIFGATPRREWQPRAGPPDADYRLSLGLNCLLLRSEDQLILVDTGLGPSDEHDSGKLLWTLAAMGIPPIDVTAVINTHLHTDHVGWNTRRSDRGQVPVFSNARYYIQRSEWDFWIHPQQLSENDYIRRSVLPLEAAGRLRLVKGEVAITDEVRLLPTPGHTPGHQSVLIRSGREAALYVGDIAHHPSMLEKGWTSAFDLMPIESKRTKSLVVEQALRDNTLLIGPHFTFPGLGRLVLDAGAVGWVEDAGGPLATIAEDRRVRRFRFLPG
jgi:glyoxylase-like metal-dependent hydrolase (beta-lactamase superfamily II)